MKENCICPCWAITYALYLRKRRPDQKRGTIRFTLHFHDRIVYCRPGALFARAWHWHLSFPYQVSDEHFVMSSAPYYSPFLMTQGIALIVLRIWPSSCRPDCHHLLVQFYPERKHFHSTCHRHGACFGWVLIISVKRNKKLFNSWIGYCFQIAWKPWYSALSLLIFSHGEHLYILS